MPHLPVSLPIDLGDGDAPTLTRTGQRMYDALSGLQPDDATYDYAYAWFCAARATMFDTLADIADRGDGKPGYTILFDPDECPAAFLPWLAQFIGVTIPPGLEEAAARLRIKETDGFQRGTPDAIKGAARQHLTGTKTVTLYERTPTPYSFLVITYTAETAAAATVDLLESSYATIGDGETAFTTIGQLEGRLSPGLAELEAALLEQKPIGLVMTHRVDDGWSIGQVEAAYAAVTLAGPEADYATIGALETHLP